ncbi:hypothetical protein AAEX28_02180 [Lentisphaerota bacterium WC36G]|nr:hypothetical protein LJT99_05065 [Lentisphaerae bacterium WC36]
MKSRCPVIFESKNDPDYQKILAFINEGKKHLDVNKRWNMPGFKPSIHYIREMKKYGVIHEDFDINKDKIDFYQTDRIYWESMWHYPQNDFGGKFKIYPNINFKKRFIAE